MSNRTCLFTWMMAILVLSATQGFTQSVYTPYTFTTFAGSAGNLGSKDGTGSAALFNFPYSVAVDSAGNLYVADTENNTIRKVSTAQVVTTMAGLAGHSGSTNGTGGNARFKFPQGVAVDNTGTVFVADTGNQMIRKVTPAGEVTTLAGLAGGSGNTDGTGNNARFKNPVGVAVDGAGNVYVADLENHTIRKITSAGDVTTLAGSAGVQGSADGTGTNAQFAFPSGVTVDGAGNVYVADRDNQTIRKVTSAGVVTTLAGLAGISGDADGTGIAARFWEPTGVAIDSADNIYVADGANVTIRKVSPAGEVTTLAGWPVLIGNKDGTGLFAGFNSPDGVAVDSAGNVYVADESNHTIRKGYRENVPAVIVASGQSFGVTNGQLGFNLTGPKGQKVVVQASTDLVSWLPIWTNIFVGTLKFSDTNSAGLSNRFYRALTP